MYISASGGKREAEGESIVSADIFRSLAICNLLKPSSVEVVVVVVLAWWWWSCSTGKGSWVAGEGEQ